MFIRAKNYSYINTDHIVNFSLKQGGDGIITLCAKTVNNDEFEIKQYLRYEQDAALRDIENVCKKIGYSPLRFL